MVSGDPEDHEAPSALGRFKRPLFSVFRTFDQDNSGAIDFKEFLLAISVTSKGTPEQKLEFAFKMYDIDSSGSIEEVEMVKVIEVRRRLGGPYGPHPKTASLQAIFDMLGVDLPSERRLELARERARLIFERLDMNKDERLTAEEFVKGCLSDDEVLHLLTNMDRTQSV